MSGTGETRGAPARWRADGEFVMVRLPMVDAVGFDAAVLFGWLRFRCELSPEGYRATREALAAETRLSEDRVKRALRVLRDAGWVETERAAKWDATNLYRVVWDDADRADSARSSGANRTRSGGGDSHHSKGGDSHRSYKEEEVLRSTKKSDDDADGEQLSLVAEQSVIESEEQKGERFFGAWWSRYPRKVGKSAARKAYVKRWREGWAPAAMAAQLEKQLAVWERDGTEERFIPHAATWLNQRLDDELKAVAHPAGPVHRDPPPRLAERWYREAEEKHGDDLSGERVAEYVRRMGRLWRAAGHPYDEEWRP